MVSIGIRRARALVSWASTLALVPGCAAAYEQATETDLSEVAADLSAGDASEEPRDTVDGSLESYLAAAMRRSPALRASFERWRAAVARIPQARRLPEPVLTYAYFVRSVETRVGPQRHRLSFRQAFPWPSKLTAGADAAAAAARSSQRRFEAETLTLRRQVADAYWRLWLVRRAAEIQRDQAQVLAALSGATRARVEVGRAGLADLSQVDLSAARAEDVLAGLDEEDRVASARLMSLLARPTDRRAEVEPRSLPEGELPAEDRAALLEAARAHPRIDSIVLLAESSDAAARHHFADRLPGFSVGVDWIETGEARQDDVPGSGTDPVVVMVGIRLPLWQHVYGGAEREARAESAAFEADAADAASRAEAALDAELSAVRDAARRMALYRDTLIPQAEGAFESVVAAYQTGESTVASTLLAQRELLELQLSLERARAEHAMAWARLEEVVGRSVEVSVREGEER